MYGEEELLPLSGLQHLVFCERQWALIHIEQLWAENRLTAEGRLLHEATHDAGREARPGVAISRGLSLRSLRLGLSGQADVVEFRAGQPFPVEYKHGKPKTDSCDRIQLCAQALCLEEMLGCVIPQGALYYGAKRKRFDVVFDQELRAVVERLALHMHDLYCAQRTPLAQEQPKCQNCSLVEICQPHKPCDARRYLRTQLHSALQETSE